MEKQKVLTKMKIKILRIFNLILEKIIIFLKKSTNFKKKD